MVVSLPSMKNYGLMYLNIDGIITKRDRKMAV